MELLPAFWLGLLPFLRSATFEAFALRQTLFVVLVSLVWLSPRVPEKKPVSHLEILAVFFVGIRSLSLWMQPPYILYGMPVLFWEFFLVLALILLRRKAPTPEAIQISLRVLLISSSLLAVIQLYLPEGFALTQGRIHANFFHPNFLGIYAVMILASELYSPQNQLWRTISVLLSGFLVIVSASRTAAVLYIMVLTAHFLIRKRQWIQPLTVIGLIGIYFYVFPLPRPPIEEYRLSLKPALQIRTAVLRSEFRALMNHPFGLGAGVHAYRIAPYRTESLKSYFPNPEKHSLYRAHAAGLEWIVESGWIMVLWLILATLVFLRQPASRAKSAALILLLASFVDVHLNYPVSQAILVILLAHMPQTSGAILTNKLQNITSLATPQWGWFFAPTFFCTFLLFYWQQRDLNTLLNQLRESRLSRAEVGSLKTIALHPARIHVEYAILQYWVEHQDTKSAQNLGNRLIRLFPGFALTEYWQAGALSLSGRTSEALKLLERGLDFHPYEEKLWEAKAQIYRETGQPQKARESLHHATLLKERNLHFREKWLSPQTPESSSEYSQTPPTD